MKQLGFYEVVEAALGADLVAYAEAAELAEKGFLTSSCCPAFVNYIHNEFPTLVENISHNPSPMVATAKAIKENCEDAKTIFIGPCTAKKNEYLRPEVSEYVDCVLTFEELQALFDSRDIAPETLEEEELHNASYYGRIFAIAAVCPRLPPRQSRSKAWTSRLNPPAAAALRNAASHCSGPPRARPPATLSRAWPA